jgi:hypothetical protein
MKTKVLIVFFGVVISINLTGQIDNNPNLFEDRKNDSLRIAPYPDDNTYNKLYKKFDLPDNIIINPDQEIRKKYYSAEIPSVNSYRDKLLTEKYPGSDIYYARRPYWTMPYEKSFIIKPDSTVKYYLIIKDPVSNMINK